MPKSNQEKLFFVHNLLENISNVTFDIRVCFNMRNVIFFLFSVEIGLG